MTQSQPAPTATPSIRRRLASMLYEALLVAGVLFFGFLLPQTFFGVATQLVVPRMLLLIHVLVLVTGYFLWFWRRGGTLAMQTWKIRLQAGDGAYAPSVGQLLLRFTLAWPSVLLFGAGLVWALFDRDRQFLHDRLAGTRLVSA